MKALQQPALWLLFLLIGFPQISETIYSPALPSIAHGLQTSNVLVQWTLSIYFIGFAIGVLAWGRLSDHMGRRKIMLFALLVYIIGSLLCLVAQDISWLLLSRCLQGIGASCGSVLTQAIVRESLTDNKRHQFFATAGFVMAFSIALGPFLGGYLTQWIGWQANFALLVLMGSSLLLLSFIHLPETLQRTSQTTAKLHHVGYRLLRDKHIWGCAWLVAIVNGILFSYYAEAPFVFIKIIGLTASQFGWLGWFVATGALLGSLASKNLVRYFSQQGLLVFGCCLLFACALLLLLGARFGDISPLHPIRSTLFIMFPIMGMIFASFGFIIPLVLGMALLKYRDVLGTAGALFGCGYYLLIAGLTWLMGAFHNGTVMAMPVYFFALSGLLMVIFWGLVKSNNNN